ncbi:hypothetical protein H4582DRAFT_1970751 [Lactarius indigo]|nr:hypothetical protein H4582DRAFT_1970751 [Lactarius indigo]
MRNAFCAAAATVHGPLQPLQSLRSTLSNGRLGQGPAALLYMRIYCVALSLYLRPRHAPDLPKSSSYLLSSLCDRQRLTVHQFTDRLSPPLLCLVLSSDPSDIALSPFFRPRHRCLGHRSTPVPLPCASAQVPHLRRSWTGISPLPRLISFCHCSFSFVSLCVLFVLLPFLLHLPTLPLPLPIFDAVLRYAYFYIHCVLGCIIAQFSCQPV